jgi:ATPase subunit of ABC transporter with duplicated ATPase domains
MPILKDEIAAVDLSSIKEAQTVAVDAHTSIKYTVVEEIIDLDRLKMELETLTAQLEQKEPSLEELAEWGRQFHPFYRINSDEINARIKEINSQLGI